MYIQRGKPNQSAFIERFNGSLRQEVLDAGPFNAVSEVQTAADDWLFDYNETGCTTPCATCRRRS